MTPDSYQRDGKSRDREAERQREKNEPLARKALPIVNASPSDRAMELLISHLTVSDPVKHLTQLLVSVDKVRPETNRL
jgi:hypothetical protein